MNGHLVPHNTKGDIVREKIPYIAILCSEVERTVLSAGLVDRSGRLPCAFKTAVHALSLGRDCRLFSCSYEFLFRFFGLAYTETIEAFRYFSTFSGGRSVRIGAARPRTTSHGLHTRTSQTTCLGALCALLAYNSRGPPLLGFSLKNLRKRCEY